MKYGISFVTLALFVSSVELELEFEIWSHGLKFVEELRNEFNLRNFLMLKSPVQKPVFNTGTFWVFKNLYV